MTQQPRVSVVVPVFNGSATIAACVEALLAQTHPATEIVIVDNNSTDDTRAIVGRYPVILLDEREIQTSYAARNRGIINASGEIVALTDADCTAERDWIEQLLLPFADESVAAVLGVVDDSASVGSVETFTTRVSPFAHPDRNGLKSLITANVAIRRSALERVGLFDERLPTAGDVDLGWRLQSQGFTIVDAPHARVRHRHRTSLSGAFAQFRRYGFGEVLLTTLHPRGAGTLTPSQHVRRMCRQSLALLSYTIAFVVRRDRQWPLFLMTIELGNVVGKLEALVATRGCRRNPFPNARIGVTTS